MADAKHKVERAAFGAAIDGILKYVNKDETDREKAFLKLVDLSEKFMGDTFRKESYDAARRMIQDPDSKWMQYVNRILNEVDPHVIKMSALDYGFEAAFCGKKRDQRDACETSVQYPLADPDGSHQCLQPALYRLLGGRVRQSSELKL